MTYLISKLPVDWQARLWWRIMRRAYGRTSHFRIEAAKALRKSAKIPLAEAVKAINRLAD